MKKGHHLHHFWLILAAYGVWFAVLSGLQEVSQGVYGKAALSLAFGIITYLIIEKTAEN